MQWRNYQSRYEAQQDIVEYIFMFYNSHRLHSNLGYVTPNEYERQLTEQQKRLNWGVTKPLTTSSSILSPRYFNTLICRELWFFPNLNAFISRTFGRLTP